MKSINMNFIKFFMSLIILNSCSNPTKPEENQILKIAYQSFEN